MSQADLKPAELILPSTLTGRPEVARLIREIESLTEQAEAETIRGGEIEPLVAAASVPLKDIAQQNNYDLTSQEGRTELTVKLHDVKKRAPIIHISFAVAAEPEFIQKIVTWMRQELHPHALVNVGLRSSVIAGCVVRTPSHIYDLGIRQTLKKRRNKLLSLIRAGVNE